MQTVKCDGCGLEIRVIVNAQRTEVLHEVPECYWFRQRLETISAFMGRKPDESKVVAKPIVVSDGKPKM